MLIRKEAVKQWLPVAMLDVSFPLKVTSSNLLALLWGKDKLVVSKLVSSVRVLHQEGEVLNGNSAKFWEGVLGNPKYEGYMHDVMQSKLIFHCDPNDSDAIHEYDGMIIGVAKKLQVCDAM